MDADTDRRIKLEKSGLNISMYGGIFFVIVEFVTSVLTTSQAVLMDAVYDAAELIMIIASIRIIPLLYRPTSEKHPFGYSQVETIFLTIKGAMLISVTVSLVLNNIQIMGSGGHRVRFGEVACFQFFAMAVSIVVILILKGIYQKTSSPLVKIEMDGWTIDCIASAGLGIAFVVPAIWDSAFILRISPYIDQITAIVLSVFILPVPVKTVLLGLRDLFLFSPEEETVNDIKEISEKILRKYELNSTTYDIIKTGRKVWISIYFTPPTDTISMSRITKIHKELEDALLEKYPDLYVELVPEWDTAK